MSLMRLVVFALAAIAADGCSGKTATQERPVPQSVQVALVREIAFTRQLELSGSLAASRQVGVGAVAAGRVVAVLVRAGDRVNAGQAIARIDDAAYRAAYVQAVGSSGAADANVALARAQSDAARSRLSLAQTTAHRMAVLYGEGAISRQQYDETQAALAASRAALAQGDAGIRVALGSRGEARGAVAAAEVPLEEVIVRAPFEGIVLSRAVDPGSVVGAGSPIATILDNSHLELDVSLPENAASAVQPGTSADVHVDSLGDRRLAARVRAVIPSDNAALRSVILKIDVAPMRGLFAGMFARVRFAGPAHRAPAVPASALITRAGQEGVFAIEGGEAVFIPVQSGETQSGWIEVHGLPVRARAVAIKGVEALTDGMTVAIQR